MGALNKVGGAVIAVALVIFIAIGTASDRGRAIWEGFWSGLQGIGRAISSVGGPLSRTAIAGNAWAAIGVSAVAFLLTLVLVPGLRIGRGFAALAVVFTGLAFVLYQPTILSGIGG